MPSCRVLPSIPPSDSPDSRSIDELDVAICRPRAADERGELSDADARARVRRSLRLREVDVQELRRVARVALWDLAVRGAREGADGAGAAHAAGNLGGVCGRAAVVLEGAGADTRRARPRRRSVAGLCAASNGGSSRRALPADSQRHAGIGARRTASVGAAVAHGVAQRSSTARCGSRSSCRSRTASSSRAPSTVLWRPVR